MSRLLACTLQVSLKKVVCPRVPADTCEPGNRRRTNSALARWFRKRSENCQTPLRADRSTCTTITNGRNAVPIKDLVGTEVPVYTHDHAAGRTVVSRMWNISVKRKNVPVYRVL